MKDKNYCAFIFARGGSKGIPDKNIRHVAGKPLIAHAIECGLNAESINTVVVSTDSDQIAEIAESFGAEILRRPAELAEDTSAEIYSWQHAVREYASRVCDTGSPFISIPATSPLRIPSDIEAGIKRFKEQQCDIVFGISPSHRSPFLNMVTIDKSDFIKIVLDDETFTRRQDVPVCFDVTTVLYIARPSYIMNTSRPIEGKASYVIIPPERALDIDTPFDLYLADLMLSHPFKEAG